MSKRNFRSLAVVAGTALALGSMAPAMAVRIDATGGAAVEVDPGTIVAELTGDLPELPDVEVPTTGQLLLLGGFVLNGSNGLLDTTFDGLTSVVGALPGDDCGLVAVASCNDIDARIPVNANGNNVLGGGILNNGGDLGVSAAVGNIRTMVSNDLSNVLSGGVLSGGLLGTGLGGILNVDADANVLAGVLAFL